MRLKPFGKILNGLLVIHLGEFLKVLCITLPVFFKAKLFKEPIYVFAVCVLTR